jgi:hypothetical protein
VEHFGQEEMPSFNARLQTGIAKNETISAIKIQSDNFLFLFIQAPHFL